MISRLVIVGSGQWASKINFVVAKTLPKTDIRHFSAREFYKLDFQTISPNDIFWIATRPNLQLKIFEQLSNQKTKIILEKPLVDKLSQLDELTNLLNSQIASSTVSQPWNYSELWNLFNLNISQITRISSTRQSSIKRDYMSALFDWAPHDFSLLNDLGIKPQNLRITKKLFEINNYVIECKDINSGLEISLNYGISCNPANKWEVENKWRMNAVLDFRNRSLHCFDFSRSLVSTHTQSSNNHPIINQLIQINWNDKKLILNNLEFYKSLLLT